MPEQAAFPAVFDSTMLSDYLACPRKFHWSYVRKLQSSKPSIHLHFGQAFAAGLDTARVSFYGYDASAEAALAAGFRRICLAWGPEDPAGIPPKTFYSCVLLLDYYLDTHDLGSDPVQPFMRQDGMPACEFTFAIPTSIPHPETGQPILYAGRFDMLGVYNDQLFVVDEKTTSQLGPTWSSQWGLRGQFIGYCWAAQQYGYPVAGAIVRGLKIATSGFDHAEPIIYAHSWMIDEWQHHIHHTIHRLLEDYTTGYFDKNFDNACTHYGGCQFRTLCETNQPERWIDGYYITRTWDPLSKQET
jgi:hypothetical protein